MTTRKPLRIARRGARIGALGFVEELVGKPLTIGTLILAIRQGEELSQASFAALLGVTRSHLCDIEKGRKVISAGRAAKFASILGYSTEQFVALALQDEVNRAGLRLIVDVKAA
jgi:transcriptional regulator with XRE-family HTH domain